MEVLDALADEGALHLLPASPNPMPAPGTAAAVPLPVLEKYVGLICSGALGKSLQTGAPLATTATSAVQKALQSGAHHTAQAETLCCYDGNCIQPCSEHLLFCIDAAVITKFRAGFGA